LSALITCRLRVISVTLEKGFQSGAHVVAGLRSRPVDECGKPPIRKRRKLYAALNQRVEVSQNVYFDGDMGLISLDSVTAKVYPAGNFLRPSL
jgi:hypothetical protein